MGPPRRVPRPGEWQVRLGILALAVVGTLFVLLPPVDGILESHEGLHHLQHAVTLLLSLLAGASAYRLLRWGARWGTPRARSWSRILLAAQNRTDPRGVVALLFAAAVILVWHWPPFFIRAIQDDTVHVVEHLFFLLAGGGVGFGLHAMNQWVRYAAILVALFSMMVFGAVLAVIQPHVYEVYPLDQEVLFGLGMVYAMMPVMVIVVYRFLVAQVS